jgi:protein phosphatase
VNEQVRIGVITGREAADTSMRHVLSRSVGSDLFVGVECTDYQLQPGDVLLLCSDGLHGAVRGEEMAHIVAHCADLNAAAHQLVAIANDRDGADNVSVQIIRIRGVERMGMYRGRPYKLQ